jgi:hypothetical protein
MRSDYKFNLDITKFNNRTAFRRVFMKAPVNLFVILIVLIRYFWF